MPRFLAPRPPDYLGCGVRWRELRWSLRETLFVGGYGVAEIGVLCQHDWPVATHAIGNAARQLWRVAA